MVSDFRNRVFKASLSVTRPSASARRFQATLIRKVNGNAYLGSKQLHRWFWNSAYWNTWGKVM